jgi:hypothetical protein
LRELGISGNAWTVQAIQGIQFFILYLRNSQFWEIAGYKEKTTLELNYAILT